MAPIKIMRLAARGDRAPRYLRMLRARSLFSSAIRSAQMPLTATFPTLPSVSPLPPRAGTTTIATTARGVKLASDTRETSISTLSVELAAGSRVETEATAGISALSAQMAFRATTARSDLRVFRDLEQLGGVLQKASGRDYVRYSISVLPDQLEGAAALLAETALQPRFAVWDIAEQKKQVQLEAELLAEDSAQLVVESLHAAAFYDDQTLGRAKVTTDNLAALDEAALRHFHQQYVNTSGLALVGSGIEHELLTAIADEWFQELPTTSKKARAPPAVYVGGEVRVKNVKKARTSVALGFPTVGRGDPKLGAAKVLQALLTRRLHQPHASAVLYSYDDVSLIGFAGDAAPNEAGALVDSFVVELKKIATTPPTHEELAVAKVNAALAEASEVGMRLGRVAALGRMALAQKKAPSPLALVEGVTAETVHEVAREALLARPSLAAVGKLSTVPRLDALLERLK